MGLTPIRLERERSREQGGMLPVGVAWREMMISRTAMTVDDGASRTSYGRVLAPSQQ
jgi:hypothetical protein